MRRRIFFRDPRSVVELQPCNLTKVVLKDVAKGRVTELANHSSNGAYDFDGEDPDFDKDLMQDPFNKFEQHMKFKELFGKHKLSAQSDQQTIADLQSQIDSLKAQLAQQEQSE